MQADPEVSGVVLAGSFARGDAYPASDLDVYVLLVNGCKRPFSAVMQQGILVEVSYADFEAAKAKIERNAMTVYTYLDGRILYDREGRLADTPAIVNLCLGRNERNLRSGSKHSSERIGDTQVGRSRRQA